MYEPIRILNLFTIMNRGGAETMVMNYYRNIDRTKVQFDFLVHREEEGAYEEEIRKLGGRIYRMPPVYPQNFFVYKRKIRVFFQNHPEYRIIHSHMSELGYWAFKEAKKQGIPVIICHAHNAPHGWDLKMFFRTYFKIRMRPYITHMFMCGEESGEWLFGRKNKPYFIQLNNAIDAQKFIYNKDLEAEVRKELELNEEFVVGHVGRFNEQKNHRRLIDIFGEIIKIQPNSKLVMIGEGNLMPEIKKRVYTMGLQDKVIFLGSREDVNRIMQIFNVFVFPSLYEGLGIVLIEAQATGIACLTSKDVVAKEAKISDLLYYYPLEESAENWAKKAIQISQERKDMHQIVIDAEYDIKSNVVKLQEFYIKVYQESL